MSALPVLPETSLGRYRHYKGGEYEVVGAVQRSEMPAPPVVCRPLYDYSGLWVRPQCSSGSTRSTAVFSRGSFSPAPEVLNHR